MRLLAIGTSIALSAGLLVTAPASAEAPTTRALDPTRPTQVELTLCQDDSELDCIETLGLVKRKGFVAGSIVSAEDPVTWGPVKPGGSDSGPTNGTATLRNEIWRIPGLRTESGLDTLNPNIGMSTPGLRWYAADSGQESEALAVIGLDLFTGRGIDSPADPPCDSASGTCWREENILPSQVLRVVIRTSTFKPAWALSPLGNTLLRIDRLSGGGSRITVQGQALEQPGFFYGGGRPLPHLRDQFDYSWYRWSVHLYDANDPRFPDSCTQYGFPLISGNQYGTGVPQWDPRNQQMDLSISAPHLDGQGKAFRGHYEAFIPAAYAKCLWQANPKRLQNRLVVEVTAENGEEQAASTSIAFRDGGVRIVARNFTFSTPTVTVRPKQKKR